jgi:hypothetical protein
MMFNCFRLKVNGRTFGFFKSEQSAELVKNSLDEMGLIYGEEWHITGEYVPDLTW